MTELFVFLSIIIFALACRGLLSLCQQLMEG